MQQTLWRLRQDDRFDVLKINLEHLKMTTEVTRVVQAIAREIIGRLKLHGITVSALDDLYHLFRRDVLPKPLILILDEFDALPEAAITGIAGVLRNIYISRQDMSERNRTTVLELFKTDVRMPFRYDDPHLNFLYQNGVIDWEQESPEAYYVKFPNPFVQKRLFNYFARDLVADTGQLYAAFENLDDIITADRVHVANLLRRFERYLQENRDWLLKDAPCKSNLRSYEAVFHFILYRYLADFLQSYRARVWPEFPTGNGKVDLLIAHAGKLYGLEVKSFTNLPNSQRSLRQAAGYGRQLGLAEVTLALFVEQVDEANRTRYEAVYEDADAGVQVKPVFVQTGK